MGSLDTCLQYGLYIFNALVFLVGAALVVIGSLFLTIFKHEFHFVRFSVNFVAIAFIAIGVALIVLVLLGVMVIRQSNSKLAVGHLLGLILAFAALATLGIWGLTIAYNGDLHEKIHMELNNTLIDYNKTTQDTIEMDWLQRKFKCCGINSYEDWDLYINETLVIDSNKLSSLKAKNHSIYDLPSSCCIVETLSTCGRQYPKLFDIYTGGCLEPFFQYFSDDLKILCGVACLLALITLIAIGFLLFVCFKTKGDYSELAQNA